MAIRNFRGTNIILGLVVLAILVLLFWPRPPVNNKAAKATATTTVTATPAESMPPLPGSLAERYKAVAKAVDIGYVERCVRELSKSPSRMVGYPGCEDAAKFVESQFRSLGLEDVKSEEFKVTVPIDKGSRIVVGGRTFPIYAIWPNLVRTSHLPPEGVKVHVIDAGRGTLPDFDGKVVKGSAALVDFNSGTEWLNAPRLGAKVLLFVEPDDTVRGEGEAKFSAIPVSMPRFWISKNDATAIRALIAAGKASNAVVYCNMPWQKVTTRNITGVIRGTDPKLRDQWIVLHAYYDSISVTPAMAPGADASCGMAALLELARLYRQGNFAPRRSVMFIATSGHYQGLAGMRAFMHKHIDEYRAPGFMDKVHKRMNDWWPVGVKRSALQPVPVLVAIVFILVVLWINARMASLKRRVPWLVAIPMVLAIISLSYAYKLNKAFVRGFDYDIPNPLKFYVWAGLDLTSQSQGVGLFYKGYFYDYREDIQSKFSDLASKARENSERIAEALGFYEQRTMRFADGVNPVTGKNWRNFIPGKFALDSEVVTLAGGKGVSFATIEDGRQLIDTPFDTINHVNFANLKKQIELIACITDHWFRDPVTARDELVEKAEVIGPKTIRVKDPMTLGYILGVYDNARAKGLSYYKPKTDKDIVKAVDGTLQLTANLPAGIKNVYVLHKPFTKLGVTEECLFTRMGLQGGFSVLSGNVVQYNPRKSFVPNDRIGDCLAVVRSAHKSFMGVRANIVDQTNPVDEHKESKKEYRKEEGYFEIPGVAPLTAYGWPRMTSIGAYKLDPVKGDIICAPDQGSYGEFYPRDFTITTGHKDMPIIVFDCKATSVYDLIDPQSLRALGGMSIFEGETHAAPRQFGVAVAVPEPQNPHVEDMAVVFTEDTAKSRSLATGERDILKRIRIQMMVSAGPAANRLLLLNNFGPHDVYPAKVIDRTTVEVETPIALEFLDGVYLNKAGKGQNYFKLDRKKDFSGVPVRRISLAHELPQDATVVFVKPQMNPYGVGYDFTTGGTLDETAYKVAHDMWTLDEFRIRSLEEKGVVNEGLNALHATAKNYLDLAEKAKNTLNYSVFDSYCRAAWGYEARAYPDVTATSQDVVNGVIFYLFLMLPFAFFCERLFFAWPDLKWQLLTFFAIFIGIFGVFKLVHPAFQIAGNAMIVLIGFIMMALSVLVIFIITSKFEEQLKQFNRSVSGIHKADIGRMSVAAAAFSLGISNMRRRKARTVLTCVTLILLTFTVLSFTSIVSVLRFNKVPAKRDIDTHIYDGIMIRTAMWEPLQEISYRLLKDEFGNEGKRGKVYPVAPRGWFFGTVMGEQSFLTLKRGNNTYDARAACGLAPDEAEIMDLYTKNRKLFVAGDWFGYKDGKRIKEMVNPHSIILPDAIAEKLGIAAKDVGKAQVEFAGAKYTVVAIIKNDVMKKMKDLDNEPLTPVDFIMMNKQSQQQQSSGEAGFREYTHLEPNSVFFIPFETLMNIGGDVRSIAIKFASIEEVQRQLDALMPRLGLNLYAGIGDSIYRYSSIAASSTKGFSNVFIPVLIAALIVLNTMLGSVYERVREIGIFSSIGLAPNHIAVLFIAESMVYANLGAVAGYVLGQTASKLLSSTNLLPGLYLNFSSSSAVVSSLIVVGVVLLSTLYPARKASEVATPAVDRSWKVPDPVGDVWNIVLPFAVTGEQARGVNGFLKEWFQAYEEYSIGDFVTQDVKADEFRNEYGTGYQVSCKAWLAPFDLGVSQFVILRTEPSSMEDVFEVKLTINRESGDVSNWKRVNRRFLNTLRKQFLIWRTMRQEERAKYLLAAATAEVNTEPAPA